MNNFKAYTIQTYLTQAVIVISILIAAYFNVYNSIALLCFFVAGWHDGLMDTTNSPNFFSKSILNNLSPEAYLLQNGSKYKYKNGNREEGEAFFGSMSTWASLTNYWYFAKMVKYSLIGIGIALAGGNWYWYFLFTYFYFGGKQTTWNILLPRKYDNTYHTYLPLTTAQRIFRAIIILPYYQLWNTTTNRTNKTLKSQYDHELFRKD